MATGRLESLEQVRAFVDGSEGLDFVGSDRSSRNDFVRRMLVKFGYGTLGKADKGLVKRFLGKATGLSRAQLTRLVRQHAKTGRIEDRRRGAPAKPFVRCHTAVDAVLLAEVDETLGQVCGQATRAGVRERLIAEGILQPDEGSATAILDKPPLATPVNLSEALAQDRRDRL